MIRPPRADELEVMLDIERDAGRAFADIGMDEIARDDPGTVVEPAEQAPELAALVRHEAAAIPGDAPRVAMRRPGHVLRTPR